MTNVIPDVEARIFLPRWISEIERRRRDNLPVSGNQVQPGFDVSDELLKRDGAIEEENGRDRERDLGPFQVQKSGVGGGQPPAKPRRGAHRQLA